MMLVGIILSLGIAAATATGLSAEQVLLSSQAVQQWSIGGGFALVWDEKRLAVTRNNQHVWATVAGVPFVSASAGNDSVVGSNGAFKITNIDHDRCRRQSVDIISNVPWNETITGNAVQVTGHLLDCGDSIVPYRLTFWVGTQLVDHVKFYLDIDSPETPVLKKLYLTYSSHAGEDIYGLGGQASFASLKNQSIPVFSREQGVGRGDEPITTYENQNGSFAGGDHYTTYTAIPSYITTDGNVFYLSEKSTGYANFNFTRADKITVRYDSLSVDGAFVSAGDMFGAVEKLTEYTGRMPPLPKWVDHGAILGIQGGQDKVQRIVQQGADVNSSVIGVWLQDWVGTHSQPGPYINISRLWWNWENDEKLYPQWNEFVQDLRDSHNVRTLSYINVFLTNVSSKASGFRRNLYDEASALHYFVQNTTLNDTAVISSGPGLEAGIIDLTNEQLVDWFANVMTDQVWNANISGFMSDFGEYTPVTSDTRLANMVSDAFFFHNAYPTLWAQFQRRLVEKLGLQDEAIIFHRSAAMSSNRNMNLFWVGDQNIDWGLNDGIKSVVTIMNHMGLSGYSQLHSDVGGYTNTLTYAGFNLTRSAELLGRWGELAAVSSAVFRSHEGNIPSVNAQFYTNSTTYRYYAYNSRMFASLGPYRRAILEQECEPKGWPLLRPPVMYHVDDLRARNISHQSFYLGPDLYVAPVLDAKVQAVDVYFPGDRQRVYKHVWSGAEYCGGQEANVAAPYGQPAVFVVNGANRSELDPFLNFVRATKSDNVKPTQLLD